MAACSSDEILKWYIGFEQMLAANPQLAQVYERLRTTPEERANVQNILEFNFHLRKDLYFNPDAVNVLLQCISLYQNQILRVPFVGDGDDGFLTEKGPLLSTNGFARLPMVDAQKVKEMYAYLDAQPVHADPVKRTKDNLIARDIVRTEHHVGILDDQAVTNCPHFLDIVLSPNILKLVEKEIGVTPTLLSLTSWWSFSGRPAPTEAQNFHMDIDDHRFIKLFIYLTDVDMNSGPHTYVPGTHDRLRITDILKSKKEEYPEIIQWYMATLRKTDEDVAKYIGISPVFFEGNAGSCFLVNTTGIHKGQLPKTKDRLILQATYGCTPTFTKPPTPIQMGTDASNNINPDILAAPNDYISRFFVTP